MQKEKQFNENSFKQAVRQNNDLKNGINIKDRRTFFGLHLTFFVCLFLSLITLAAYWQVKNLQFAYDDSGYITENYHTQEGVTLENIVWSLSAEVASNWHPLTLLSHMIDCQIYGLNPAGHHLTGLLFHIANSLLLFLVLKRMTNALWQSAFVATFFAIHPLHVESVAWVSERKDVLSTFFWLMTMWSYARYAQRPGMRRYLPVLLFLILGLMSKPMLVTLPFVLLLLDYWPLKRFQFDRPGGWRLVVEKIPLFVFVAASCIVTFHFQQSGGAVGSLDLYPFHLRLTNAIISYMKYILNMFWPFKLAAIYPYPAFWPTWQIIGACLLLLSLTIFSVRTLKQHPYIAVGWFWYLGTLVPVIGLVQVGSQSMADRYTYVPLIGIFIVIAWGSPHLAAQWQLRKTWFAITAAMLLSILTATTLMQVRHWTNNTTLFEHALHVTTDNYVAHNILGVALVKQGKISEAICHYSESLRINPINADVHCNLGNALANQGKIAEAFSQFSKALQIDPEDAFIHYNLGTFLAKQKRITEASKHFSAALRINPDFTRAHNNLGNLLAMQGKVSEAVKHYSEVLRLDPDSYQGYYNLACIYATQNQIDESIDWLKKALDNGFDNWELLKSDKDLENIRNTTYYMKLMDSDKCR